VSQEWVYLIPWASTRGWATLQSAIAYGQGLIEPRSGERACNGHSTYVDGESLNVTKIVQRSMNKPVQEHLYQAVWRPSTTLRL
jgi:hypothetical protein